jgi:hypothetical protein
MRAPMSPPPARKLRAGAALDPERWKSDELIEILG